MKKPFSGPDSVSLHRENLIGGKMRNGGNWHDKITSSAINDVGWRLSFCRPLRDERHCNLIPSKAFCFNFLEIERRPRDFYRFPVESWHLITAAGRDRSTICILIVLVPPKVPLSGRPLSSVIFRCDEEMGRSGHNFPPVSLTKGQSDKLKAL